MKNVLLPFIVACLFGCTHRPAMKTGLEGKPIPSFDLLLQDSATHLNTGLIPAGEPVVFFYFSPYCPYCRAQMQNLIANIKDLQGIRFILVTAFPYSDMKAFYKHYDLARYSNITIGEDYKQAFGDYFRTSQVPYLAVYDKQRKLKQVNLGKLYSNEIKDIAFQ